MKRTVLSSLLLVSLLVWILPGCGRSVSGRYVNAKNSREYMELKTDGTFYIEQINALTGRRFALSGKYRVEGDVITWTLEGGLAARGKIERNTIIDDEGKRWVKQ